MYFLKQFWGGFYSKLPNYHNYINRWGIWTNIYQASRLVQSQRLEELPQFSTMVRDRENTFCTSGTYKSANQSQATILFSQPIRTEYTVLHNGEGQGKYIFHIWHLHVSQPIKGHYYFRQPIIIEYTILHRGVMLSGTNNEYLSSTCRRSNLTSTATTGEPLT